MTQAAKKIPSRPHVKKGDQVQVMAGKAKGQVGEVLRVDRQRQFAYVKDVNLQKRHTKPRRQGEPGGIISIEGPIHLSNVLGFCPVCNKGVRKLATHTVARHEKKD